MLYSSFTHTALRGLSLQLMIMLVATPIMMAWGLGISIFTIISNLMFPPLLMVFLILCSLIFIVTGLGFDAPMLAFFLNRLVDAWLGMMSFAQPWNMLSPACPPLTLLVMVPLITLICIIKFAHKQSMRQIMLSSAGLCVLLCAGMICGAARRQAGGCREISKRLQVLPVQKTSTLIVFDKGFFGRHGNAESTVSYQFLPLLISHYGTTQIAELHLKTAGYRSLKATYLLCKRGFVKNIFIPPLLHGTPRYTRQLYKKLIECCNQKNIRVVIDSAAKT